MQKMLSFSVIIPVYVGSSTLDETIEKILSWRYPAKELIVCVDCPNEQTKESIKRYGDNVIFNISEERRGKVNSLNEGLRLATGEAFLFLDADVSITGEDLLERMNEELQENDIVELKKVIRQDSLISKLVYYEYIGITAADWIISNKTRRTFGINGAAFAMTREALDRVGGFRGAIAEDLDLGLRCYQAGLRFKFLDDISVQTFAPQNLSGWFRQRKRWAFGTALWVRENWRQIFSMVKSKPSVCIPALLMIFPSLLGLFSSLAFKDLAIWDAAALLFISLPTRGFFIIVFPFLSFQEINSLISFFAAFFMGLLAYLVTYYFFSRKLKLKFSAFWFTLYYLIYSPAWLAAMLWGLVQVFVAEDDVSLDWKV